MSIQNIEDLKQQYLDEMKTLINEKDYRSGRIDIKIKINELKENFNEMTIKINKKKKLQQLEQVANLSTYPSRHFNSFCYNDDDDEEYTIAITPEKPVESLIMEDEYLDTIPETESDEFIKSTDRHIPVDVPNIFPTHSALQLDFEFIPSHNDLGSDPDISSPFGDRNMVYDPRICIEIESKRFLAPLSPVIDTLLPISSENKDKVFNRGILAYKEKSPPSSSHRGLKAFQLSTESPMMIHGDNTLNLGVRHPHFYPLARSSYGGNRVKAK
ncbi:hypothetical protein Tco_0963433 [Tanacetum coccineum]